MTFLYIIICIIIFIGFSYEDLSKLNPISSISEISDIEPKKINMKEEKIWIPFRLVNDENQFKIIENCYIFFHILSKEILALSLE